MKNTEKKRLLIWLSSAGLFFYVENSPSLLFFSFSDDTVRFMDIYDEQKFTSRLEDFLKQNNITGLDTYFIVGQDTLNEADFQAGNNEAIEHFITNVPYETVYSKKTVNNQTVHVAAFNGDIYQTTEYIMRKHDCLVQAVLPYYLLPQERLDIGNAKKFLNNAETLKIESFVNTSNTETLSENSDNNNTHSVKKEKSSLPVLIPVFIVLLLVLVAVVLMTR